MNSNTEYMLELENIAREWRQVGQRLQQQMNRLELPTDNSLLLALGAALAFAEDREATARVRLAQITQRR